VELIDPDFHVGTLKLRLVTTLGEHVDEDCAIGSGNDSSDNASASFGSCELCKELGINLRGDVSGFVRDNAF